MVNMTDGDAEAHFVQDISNVAEGNWRWARQRPTVKLKIRTNENLKFTIDFSIAEVTLKDTGPVNLSFYVNDHLLEKVPYAMPGQMHYEKPVPPEWVEPGKDVTLAAEIDKVWIAKGDGAKLGFILTRIGLTQ